jgi:hypothetical protein
VLFAGLLLAWLLPDAWLLAMPLPLRLTCAVTVAFLPIFAANVIFAKRFRETADGTAAFGANLLGAMVGGVLEYGALVVGYRNLLVLVALLYGLAFVTGRRHLGATDHAVGAPATSPLGSSPGG